MKEKALKRKCFKSKSRFELSSEICFPSSAHHPGATNPKPHNLRPRQDECRRHTQQHSSRGLFRPALAQLSRPDRPLLRIGHLTKIKRPPRLNHSCMRDLMKSSRGTHSNFGLAGVFKLSMKSFHHKYCYMLSATPAMLKAGEICVCVCVFFFCLGHCCANLFFK